MEQHQRSAAEVVADILERHQAEARIWEADGRDAWSELRKLGNKNLAKGDEVIIARSLFAEFPRLKAALKAQGLSLGKFCKKAGLGDDGSYSKELHRMMLPPETTPERIGLRRSANKYRSLLKEMASIYNVSPSGLASRLMLGMSIHPVDSETSDKLGLIQALLQGCVDHVDQVFGLFGLFMETAELKTKHAQAGGSCRWPHWDAEYRLDNFLPVDLAAKKLLQTLCNDPTVDMSEAEFQAADNAARKTELSSAMDKARAYWESPATQKEKPIESWLVGPTMSGCQMSDEFFYVPHAYLGFGEGICTPPDGDPNSSEYKQSIARLRKQALASFNTYGVEPKDEWNEETQKPTGQITSMADAMAHYHAWIIAYPSPDNTRLMPMLLLPIEECGPILIPLDVVTLSWLGKTYWVGPEGQTASFLDRIQDLIGWREGDPKIILDALRRTAPWLHKNPIMKLKEKEIKTQEYLRAYLSYLAGENRDKAT